MKGRTRVNAQVVLRLLDTFFRRLWLFLVPIVLLGGAGAWAVATGQDSYRSVGTMKVERAALVAEVTGSQTDPGFGWNTPAGATAESFNALLRTGTFLDEIVVTAGLEEEIATGQLTVHELRSSIAVYADGVRLVKVAGVHARPDVAYALARAAAATYIDSVEANEVSDSVVARDFLQEKLPEYEQAVAEAEAELRSWIADNPPPADGTARPEDELVDLDRLQDAVALQDERLTQAQRNIEQAELSVEQKEAEVRQRYAIIDPPQEPLAPEPRLRRAIMTMAMALVVGALVSLAAVVVGTILDRTIRFPGDVKDRLGTRVLAVVPRARISPAVRKRLEEAASGDAADVRGRLQSAAHDRAAATPPGAVAVDLADRSPARAAEAVNGSQRETQRTSIPLKRVN